MILLYLSSCLCLYDEKAYSDDFKIYLFLVEAYAKQVFHHSDSVYIFLQTALCDSASSVNHLVTLFMPDFVIDTKTNETDLFVKYIIKISNRLLKIDDTWYGKMLIENVMEALQSERFFLTSKNEELINRLTNELEKYNDD